MPQIEFDDIIINRELHHIHKAGVMMELEPKSFRVLEYLIEHRNRVVPKDELIAKIWEGAAVTDNALTRVIAQIRKALGDDARQARYIETVPTIGYRFIFPLPSDAPAPPLPPQAPEEEPRKINWLVPVGAIVALIAVWFGPYLKSLTSDPSKPRPPRTAQFTTSKGLDMHPSFNPDASSVVYASDKDGKFELYIRQVDGGRDIPITSDGKQNLEPAWSPDGKSVAYTQLASQSIYVMPALGGIPRRLTEFGSQPAWSPDGSLIAFRSEGITSMASPELFPGTDTTIWVVPAAGAKPEQLTQTAMTGGRHSQPRFSPKGRHLAFLSMQPFKSSDLWELDMATRKAAQVTTAGITVSAFAYDTDGASLYLIGHSPEVQSGLYRLRRDPSTRSPIGPPELLTRIDFIEVRDLWINQQGTRMAYMATRATSHIWSVTQAGQAKSLIEDATYRVTEPAWSPDGKKLGYVLRKYGALGDIYISDPDGSNATQITRNPGPDAFLTWAPDSQSVWYLSRLNPNTEVRRVAFADGAERPMATMPALAVQSRIAPDLSAVTVMHNGQLQLFDIASATLRPLAGREGHVGFPCWSPDSKTLAVEIREGDATHIGLVQREGGAVRQITNRPGHAWPHSFSADGKQLALAATWDGFWNIYTLDIATNEIRQLTKNTLGRIFVRYPAWSPLGDPIVYEQHETRGNLYIAELPGAPPAASR
ncbi:MAG: PD40 domain-containing protein [Bryobacterales bacterium]|nr:PD40 domain-containing protein [Bryobacterales bacterium]